MPPSMYSLDQTAKSAAANSTDNTIVAVIARRRQIFIYIILYYLAVIPNRTTSPATLYRRELGVAFLITIKDGAPALWQRLFRMTKPSFDALCGWLMENTMFKRSREVLECNKGGPRVGNSAWLNAMQQRRHWRQRCRWLKVSVAIYLSCNLRE